MDNELKFFLLAAEELNISKAAGKAFVSQQYMSKCIKHLESTLNVTLFKRRPSLTLTLAGEIVRQYALSQKMQEKNLFVELSEMKNEEGGQLVYGSSYGRTLIMFPSILRSFQESYPKVLVTVKNEMTSLMEKMTINGEIDVFIGVNTKKSPNLNQILLNMETIYIALSDNLLRRHFGNEYPDCVMRFSNGIDLHELQNIPFCIHPSESITNKIIQDFMKTEQITLNYPIIVNGNEIQLELAQKSCCACFCQSFLLPFVSNLNSISRKNKLHVFPIKNFDIKYPISLVYRKDAALPGYTKHFISLVKQYIINQGERNGYILGKLSAH